MAAERLAGAGHQFTPLRVDLEQTPLLAGSWNAISVLSYRPGALWPALRNALAPGGVLVVEVLHVLNAERHERPSRRWLAEPGEVAAGLGELEVLYLEEGWYQGRGLARAIARKPRLA
jgi:hypothetical protein